jgi:hypothetical protein
LSCVYEKPSIQALEWAQGYLRPPNGRALTGQKLHMEDVLKGGASCKDDLAQHAALHGRRTRDHP